MSYVIEAIDYDMLPEALLDLAKQHMRVDFDDDDDLIISYLQNALSIFERITGQRVNPATVKWTPDINATAYQYQTPLQPVEGFSVMSAAVDISSQFRIDSASPVQPVWLTHSDRTPFPSDADITLSVGISDAAMLPPVVRDAVFRVAAKLYEYRESVYTTLDMVPQWMNEMIVGTWIPRA